jgi:hypothetical protein
LSLKNTGFLSPEAENIKKDIRKEFSNIFALVDEVNEFCYSVIALIKINSESLQDFLIATLLAKIMHGFQATIILAQYGLETDCKIVLRSLLDTIFVFGSICKDEKFVYEYLMSEKSNQLKLINAALNNQDDLCIDLEIIDKLKKRKDRLKNEVDSIKIKKFTSEFLAKKAGLNSVYQTKYRELSIDVHTLPLSLDSFLDFDNDKNVESIKLGPGVNFIKTNLCSAIGVFLHAIGCICNLKQINKDDSIKKYEEKLKSIVE